MVDGYMAWPRDHSILTQEPILSSSPNSLVCCRSCREISVERYIEFDSPTTPRGQISATIWASARTIGYKLGLGNLRDWMPTVGDQPPPAWTNPDNPFTR